MIDLGKRLPGEPVARGSGHVMDQRDWLAGLAMQGLLTGTLRSISDNDSWTFNDIATGAYELADAMIAKMRADEKGPP